MKRIVTVLAVLSLLCIIPMGSESVSAMDDEDDEYWCYGDMINLDYDGNSANVSWVVRDSSGMQRGASDGDTLTFDATRYNVIYVTQTVTTGQGSSIQNIKINLMHQKGNPLKVTFYSDAGGDILRSYTFDEYTVCKNGIFAEEPDEPEAPSDNMVFGGWFYQSGGVEREFSSTDPVRSSKDVYAKWLSQHTVMFFSNGTYYGSSVVTEGERLELPEPPGREGMTFAGWYRDPAFNSPFDGNSDIPDDQVLYAKWSKNVEQRTFSPVLVIPLGIVAVFFLWTRTKKQKRKTHSKSRYL